MYLLRVSLDARYQAIIDECRAAMSIVSAGRSVLCQRPKGCVVLGAYWKHWPCLFPQHGRGPKHLRCLDLTIGRRADVARIDAFVGPKA